ncbi:hypothetical protein F4824DRAFT_452856 [Ustulina deusta]|nr:hypothetical protein F4823DRAFT_607188 [Ustulina deusta]KAI3340323.1 hypothetical protein F4824DRAFT_452856 [Ustulina deusta]
MNCACRTKSLRIFVQSLTELRVTDPIVTRSVRLNYLGSSIAFRQVPTRHPTRLFSSSTAAYSSGQKWRDDASTLSADKAGEESPHASIRTAVDTSNNDSPTLTPSVSGNDLAAAKLNGAILDYSPESIDTLIASLDQTSITGQEGIMEEHNNLDSDAQSKSPSRPKPPVTSSQLKRRKIIKEDKPQSRGGGGKPGRRIDWAIQKQALKEKFPEGWQPRKRLSPDALDGIRALHSQFPEQYTTEVLARNFAVSAEAIRRILKGKWTPNPEEEVRREERWFNRGKNIWAQMAELGKKPPRRWRMEGIVRKPHFNRKRGPRNEYPYVPRREPEAEYRGPPVDMEPAVESAQRRLSSNLL